MRLFAAILMEQACRETMARAMARLRALGVRGRFVHPGQLHLTLAFLGELPSEMPALRALEGLACEPFLLRLGALGRFKQREGDVLWMGVDGGQALAELQARLAGRLREEGIGLEERPYRPHLTLARQARVESFEAVQRELAGEGFRCAMQVQKVSLMESRPQNGRYEHIVLAEKNLSGPGK